MSLSKVAILPRLLLENCRQACTSSERILVNPERRRTRPEERVALVRTILWAPRRISLRVGPKSSSTQTKFLSMRRIEARWRKASAFRARFFEILGQPAAAIKPSESAFDNPTSRQKLEPFARSERLTIRFADAAGFWLKPFERPGPDIRHQQRAFAKMDTNRTKWREQARPVTILNIGWMHNSMKQQA